MAIRTEHALFHAKTLENLLKTFSFRGLSPAALKALRQVYADYAPALRNQRVEAMRLEHRVSELVMATYQLTPEEIALLWRTAPPRMPAVPSTDQLGGAR